MNTEKIKVLIVDDHLMFLEGLIAMLKGLQEIEIVGSALNGKEALGLLETMNVHVLITDLSMPEMDGEELIENVIKKYPEINILILSTYSDGQVIERMIKRGVRGYLLKNAEKNEFIKAIHTLNNGEKYFSETVKNEFIQSTFSNKKADVPFRLSRREKEILKLISSECTTAEIAEKLFISQNTVNTHRKNLLSKIGVKNTAGLVKFAIQNGYIEA